MTITKIKSDLPMRIGVGVILLNNKKFISSDFNVSWLDKEKVI